MPEFNKEPGEYRDTLFEVSEFLGKDVAHDLKETLGVLETAMHDEIKSRYKGDDQHLPATGSLVKERSGTKTTDRLSTSSLGHLEIPFETCSFVEREADLDRHLPMPDLVVLDVAAGLQNLEPAKVS
jgi:hypothetical protein